MTHFVKHLARIIQVTTFTVHVDKVVGDEQVGRVNGVVSHHVAVQGEAFSEATVASALVE